MNNQRYPMNGTFELTGRCNLSCKMCLVRVGHECHKKERTAKEWINMAEQIRDAGTFSLLLTGGEVMLRPDFCEIYEAIAQMGFVLTLYTNATMVTDQIMEVLKKYPPHKIGVTMYGASNETYEKMCGCKDGYDRFVEGLRKLETLPSLLDTRTTIIKDNLHDLPAMKEFINKEFNGEKILTVSRFVADSVRGAVAHPKTCRLSPKENVQMIYSDLVKLVRKTETGELVLPNIDDKYVVSSGTKQPEGYYMFSQCGAGINQFAINWEGKMYACEMLAQGYTEPFKDGFDYAWQHLPEQYPLTKNIEKCANCQLAGLCGTCPATRLAETGDWYGISEYACEEAEELFELLTKVDIV